MEPFLSGTVVIANILLFQERERDKGLPPKRIRNPDLVLCICLSIFILTSSSLGLETDELTMNSFPYSCSTTPKLIEEGGYASESHTVTTDDGYILTMQRVISTTTQNTSVPKQTVLLQHGLMGNSAHYTIQDTPEHSLAIFLANAGYDVWLGNFRGNCYSPDHQYLNQQSPQYWDFSWHELGIYDLPAMIDYVLDSTGSPDLSYIGHSMGTTAGFVCLSKKPEYNKKCKLIVSLAPVCYMTNADIILLKLLAPFCLPGSPCDLMCTLYSEWGTGKFMPCNDWMRECSAAACSIPFCQKSICSSAVCSLCGCSASTNPDLWDEVICQFLQGSSTKTMVHYAQVRNANTFREYDYGTTENLKNYGTLTPPCYDLSKITTRMCLMASDNDKLSNMTDVKRLAKELTGTSPKVYELKGMGHVDYLFAKDVTMPVNERVHEMLKKTQNSAI